MNRRKFLGLVAITFCAPTARAQPPANPVIGFLHSGSQQPFAQNMASFHGGLREAGYVAGKNLTIEYRWADGDFDRLPALARELVDRKVAVLAAFAPPTALAAKAATTTIPVVFAMGGDAVKLGLVKSLNRPGGNITGVSFLTVELIAKRLEIFRALVPNAKTIGFLVNPSNPTAETQLKAIQTAALALGLQLRVSRADSENEIDDAFTGLAQTHAEGLVVGADSFFNSRRDKLVTLAALQASSDLRDSRGRSGRRTDQLRAKL